MYEFFTLFRVIINLNFDSVLYIHIYMYSEFSQFFFIFFLFFIPKLSFLSGMGLCEADSVESLGSHRASLTHARLLMHQRDSTGSPAPPRLNRSNSIRCALILSRFIDFHFLDNNLKASSNHQYYNLFL